MKLQATEHSYYCSESNHYVGNQHGENFGRCEYDTWADFKEEWLDSDGMSIDMDYNLCFRFDIKQKHNPDTDEPIEDFELWLFFMLQRKGIYRPAWIKHIEEKDMPGIKGFLEKQRNYIQYQWNELIEK